MILPITLTVAGAAALINIWLMFRVGQVRTSEKISVGDGGNEKVIRRMRAHSNYIESAPFVVLLVAAIELASATSPIWLWIVSGFYLLGRVAHGVGMDDGKFGKGRMIGTIMTMLALLGLGIYAILIPYLGF
ncbi:MAG: MAPEG family protein [Sphingomonadales bacterium]|nr:MAPEG family protein [Sphingomonadales bacterium]PIX65527.1 MAG: GST-like protein [Sphingomonadales bacterium CG_4_10_14_3_um_filter_58_15]NCO49271.1 MAPEG family protein [Sphingomonadales bacterium]NCP01250.1 MAPEG family protein [Sphingomonadales bacterium]NCP28234.1 MAPEG family protein [Sphingomonadales bacterium]